uniref:Uncharacterized protein n=1 Tax=Opuntia streptacantha TaxID=393608 RepID=A0A7C8YKJ7_OPUST
MIATMHTNNSGKPSCTLLSAFLFLRNAISCCNVSLSRKASRLSSVSLEMVISASLSFDSSTRSFDFISSTSLNSFCSSSLIKILGSITTAGSIALRTSSLVGSESTSFTSLDTSSSVGSNFTFLILISSAFRS